MGVADIDTINKNIYRVEGKLNTYKVLISNIATQVLFLLSMSFFVNYEEGMGFFMLLIAGVVWIVDIKNTRKYINKSLILAILFTTIGSGYYSLYLIIMTVVNNGKKAELKKELADLKFNGMAQ